MKYSRKRFNFIIEYSIAAFFIMAMFVGAMFLFANYSNTADKFELMGAIILTLISVVFGFGIFGLGIFERRGYSIQMSFAGLAFITIVSCILLILSFTSKAQSFAEFFKALGFPLVLLVLFMLCGVLMIVYNLREVTKARAKRKANGAPKNRLSQDELDMIARIKRLRDARTSIEICFNEEVEEPTQLNEVDELLAKKILNRSKAVIFFPFLFSGSIFLTFSISLLVSVLSGTTVATFKQILPLLIVALTMGFFAFIPLGMFAVGLARIIKSNIALKNGEISTGELYDYYVSYDKRGRVLPGEYALLFGFYNKNGEEVIVRTPPTYSRSEFLSLMKNGKPNIKYYKNCAVIVGPFPQGEK